MKRKRKQPKAVPCELAVNLHLMHAITEDELAEHFETKPIAEGKVAEEYRLRASHVGAMIDSAAPEVYKRLDIRFAEILCRDDGTLRVRIRASWPKGYGNVLITYVDDVDIGEEFEERAASEDRWLLHLIRAEADNPNIPLDYWVSTDFEALPAMRASQMQRFMKTLLGAVLHSPKQDENLPPSFAVVGDNQWYEDTCEWWHGYRESLPRKPLQQGRLGELKLEHL